MRYKDKLTLIALLVLFALPPIAAYSMYFANLLPKGKSNKGTLIDPVIELPQLASTIQQNRPNSKLHFQGRWNLVMLIADRHCDLLCQKNIYLMRQVQTALGKESSAVKRILLMQQTGPDQSFQKFLNDYPRQEILLLNPSLKNFFSQVTQEFYGRVFIVDPAGNLMMYHHQEFDPHDLLSDLKRLILVNR